MKKMISVLGAISIASTSLSTVVACGAESVAIKMLIDGKNEFKIDSNTVSYEKVFGNQTMLADTAFKVLEALTFTETKFQNPEKLQNQKDSLGTTGLALSLDNLQDENVSSESNVTFTGDKKDFWAGYSAPVNSSFKEINFDLGLSEQQIGDNDKWISSKTSVFDASKANALLVDIDYDSSGLVVENGITKVDSEQNTLQDFINLTWNDAELGTKLTADLKSEFGAMQIYKMGDDNANNLYDKLAALSDDDTTAKELIQNLTKEQFRVLHTQLDAINTRLKNGIIMLGSFENHFNNSIETSIADYQNESHDIASGLTFFKSEDNKSLQAQVLGGSTNSKRTFVYGNSDTDTTFNIDFKFNVPAISKTGTPETNYSIKLSLNNIIVGYHLNAMILERGLTFDSARTDKVLYWYEPGTYQFTNSGIFKNNSSSSGNNGTKNAFDRLAGATINLVKE